MSQAQNISTFAELEERTREIELEVEVSQRELAHSLGTSRNDLNNFLLKRVALPIGGAIAGIWIFSKLRKRKSNKEVESTSIERSPDYEDPAKYHFPVPPPRGQGDRSPSAYVAQKPRYDRLSPPPPEDSSSTLSSHHKKSLINIATIASVAKIAVPAVQMIFKAVQDHQDASK